MAAATSMTSTLPGDGVRHGLPAARVEGGRQSRVAERGVVCHGCRHGVATRRGGESLLTVAESLVALAPAWAVSFSATAAGAELLLASASVAGLLRCNISAKLCQRSFNLAYRQSCNRSIAQIKGALCLTPGSIYAMADFN